MSRVIFVPQYPTPMRYQEWWYMEFQKEFEAAGFEVVTLGRGWTNDKYDNNNREMFSSPKHAIEFETKQINEYMRMDIKSDDILFLADISFPGFFANVMFHKRPKRCFAFCHATSINFLDYFGGTAVQKFPVESAHAQLFNKIFVGSKYHQNKLKWSNTIVTYLPFPPDSITFKRYNTPWNEKLYKIVSASRPTLQKVDSEVESEIEYIFRTEIIRSNFDTWNEYYRFLSRSKILLITSLEDTFGYQIVDAYLNGCIPLVPNRCAYGEIVPTDFIYASKQELIGKIDYILNSNVPIPRIPELLCEGNMKNFYRNIIKEMTVEEYPF
jgi:hypothetical protein